VIMALVTSILSGPVLGRLNPAPRMQPAS
jgi:hypothetical protein